MAQPPAASGSDAAGLAPRAGDDPFAQRRRASALTRLASVLFGTFLTGLGAWLAFVGSDDPIAAALIAAGLARFALLWLEPRGFVTTTSLVANFSGTLLYVVALLDVGTAAGVEAWAPVMVAMPVLIMGPQHGPFRKFVPLLNVAVIAGVETLAHRWPPFHYIEPWMLNAIRLINFAGATIVMAGMVTAYRKLLDRAERRVAEEQERSEQLLANILPNPIAARLKLGESPIADSHAAATIMFADIVNFTPFAAHLPADRLVNLLNRLFQAFDDMTDRRGLEKIKTIGDAYMVGGGLDDRGTGAEAMAELAFDMLALAAKIRAEMQLGLELRIGIHTGPLVAGVIGKRKFSYDVWGDTVNTAARLADASKPGRILISAAATAALGPGWRVEQCGSIALKGLGEVSAGFLLGRADALAAAAE